MSNILMYILIIFMVIVGGLSTIYVVSSLPVVLVYKIFRKIKFGEKIL